MTDTPAQAKAALRRTLEARRNAIPAETRATLSALLCARAAARPEFETARTIHCYLPMRSEVDGRPLIRAALASGKQVAVPIFVRRSDATPCALIDRLDEDAFESDGFGLSHPRDARLIDPADIDIVYVPLLGFAHVDGRWHRIGYGAGYYDTFLAGLAPHTLKIGIAFAAQRLDGFPVEAHDTPLDEILVVGTGDESTNVADRPRG